MFEFLQSIADWFSTGIYDFFTELAAYFITNMMIWYWKSKLSGLEFAWGVAQSILSTLNIGSTIQSYWAMLPGEVASGAAFFRVPEAISLMLTALATRFVLNFLPFL